MNYIAKPKPEFVKIRKEARHGCTSIAVTYKIFENGDYEFDCAYLWYDRINIEIPQEVLDEWNMLEMLEGNIDWVGEYMSEVDGEAEYRQICDQ